MTQHMVEVRMKVGTTTIVIYAPTEEEARNEANVLARVLAGVKSAQKKPKE